MRHPTAQEETRLMEVKERLMRTVSDELATGDITAPELLALFAHMTGLVLAYQDRGEITPADGLRLIHANVISGNRVGLATLFNATTRH